MTSRKMPSLDLQVHSYALTEPHALRPVLLIRVVSRTPGEPPQWKISEGASTLSKAGEWVWEPLPSNRSEKYKEMNYYASIEDALVVWDANKTTFDPTIT